MTHALWVMSLAWYMLQTHRCEVNMPQRNPTIPSHWALLKTCLSPSHSLPVTELMFSTKHVARTLALHIFGKLPLLHVLSPYNLRTRWDEENNRNDMPRWAVTNPKFTHWRYSTRFCDASKKFIPFKACCLSIYSLILETYPFNSIRSSQDSSGLKWKARCAPEKGGAWSSWREKDTDCYLHTSG